MSNESELSIVTDRYAIWNADTVDVAAKMPAQSADLTVTSLPFSSLYVYSNSPRDMGNVRNDAEFFSHYDYLVREQARVMKPGRILAIHCMDLPTSKERDGHIGLRDFPGDIIRAYEKHGFIYHSRVCIWKDPVLAMQRTKALGLLHKQLKKNSAMSRQGIADTMIVMRTPGDNPDPVSHTNESFPVARWQRYASPVWASFDRVGEDDFLQFCNPSGDAQGDGIDMSDTLQAKSAREHDDERHLAPLQLDVIRRCVRLWSNENDVVWDPFTGIGSTGVVALQEKRRFIGAELKLSYCKQAIRNLEYAADNRQQDIFALVETQESA